MAVLTLSTIVVALCLCRVEGWNKDSVILKDIDVLTLYNNRMTAARRSSPIPQLKCVGGNAGCSSFVPQVVQCYNRGTDGFDVQWECKTDMDNAYRFGQIEVSCEGYEYPDDPYVLRGSCGLEYTLELTKEGQQQQSGGGHHNYYQDGHSNYHQDDQHSSWSSVKPSKRSSWMGDIIMLVIVGVVVYAIYHTCIANTGDYGGGNYGQDHPNDRRSGNRPPPYGFRQDHGDDDDSGSCPGSHGGGTYSSTNYGSTPRTGAGNFWTGAATGGLLGYLFGSRTNTYQQPYGYGNTGYGRGWGSGWGGMGSGWGGGRTSFGGGGRSSFGGGFGGSSFGGGSTGTRTASGFGGTRRR